MDKVDLTHITGITANSKNVKPGYGFVVMHGINRDGMDFLKDALERGASVIFTDREVAINAVNVIRVEDTVDFFWDAYCKFYSVLPERFFSIAVTGTNGKTTVCYLLESILGRNSTLRIGTLGAYFGEKYISLTNTTPSLEQFLSLLKMASDYGGIAHLVMEVSSHSLEQRRLGKMKFDIAVFTNLSRDHLDYHSSMQNYFAAKLRLFLDHIKETGMAVVCVNNEWGKKLVNILSERKISVITVGFDNKADVFVRVIDMDVSGMRLRIKFLSSGREFLLETPFIGEHNAINIATSFAVLSYLSDIDLDKICLDFAAILPPVGRLEPLFVKDRYVFIDYAHTPDGLKVVLDTLLKVKGSGRLICVFGCGGNRDKGKRPLMGNIASEMADFVILTSDNPRWEDVGVIIDDIYVGVDVQNRYKVKIVPDRRDAILYALNMSQEKDFILIAGKGHEDYQEIKGEKIHFSDKEVVQLWAQ